MLFLETTILFTVRLYQVCHKKNRGDGVNLTTVLILHSEVRFWLRSESQRARKGTITNQMRYLDMLVAYVGKKSKSPTSQTWVQNCFILINVSHIHRACAMVFV